MYFVSRLLSQWDRFYASVYSYVAVSHMLSMKHSLPADFGLITRVVPLPYPAIRTTTSLIHKICLLWIYTKSWKILFTGTEYFLNARNKLSEKVIILDQTIVMTSVFASHALSLPFLPSFEWFAEFECKPLGKFLSNNVNRKLF